jgi:hypothetical protein
MNKEHLAQSASSCSAMPLERHCNSTKRPVFLFLTFVSIASLSNAAVITPQTGGSIDPTGGSELDYNATGSVSLATFESTTSNRVIQANWTGIGGTTGNTIDHDAGGNDDGVDVRIDHTVGGFSASASTTSSYNSSSQGNGYLWTGSNGQQLKISFGTASGASSQVFTNDRAVTAAGLMLMNFGGAWTNVAINYFDSANTVLSSQSFSGNSDLQDGSGGDFFTGYISSSANISYLTIDITRPTGTSSIALDAVTFAGPNVVPEPASAALLGLGTIGLLLRRNRRAA